MNQALLLAVLVLAACGGTAPAFPPASPKASAPAQLTPIGIQISAVGLAFFPLFVAKDLGIFEKHGLDVKLVAMPPPAGVAAIEKGDLQFMATIGSAA